MKASSVVAGCLSALLLAGAVSSASADSGAGNDIHHAKQSIKDAGHSLGNGIKKVSHKIGDGVRNGVHSVKRKLHKKTMDK